MHHPITGYENLHRHSDFSLLDGFAKVSEYAERQKEINQKFLCITDHGVMGAIPQQIAESDKHKLFPLFGIELYLNPMQIHARNREESAEFRKSLGDGSTPERTIPDGLKASPMQKKFDKSHHLLAIAKNNIGYSNLVRLSSWAWIHGFYRRPRVNHEVLERYKEGIIFTSTCGNSEIANAYMGGEGLDEEAGFAMIEKYIHMFGRENFYLELMMLDWIKQKPYDAFLLKAQQRYNLKFIISQDCFLGGTLVLTDKGLKKIENILIGDMVLTHKNRFMPVEVIASRKTKKEEKIYCVKGSVGSYAFEATGNHKIYVASKVKNVWSLEWKKVKELEPKVHKLLVPKIPKESIFNSVDLNEINIMNFLKEEDYQIGDKYNSSNSGNMGCFLQYDPEKGQLISYRGFNRSNKTVIPSKINVDDDFLKMIGWYIAEGWSETGKLQVGFALNETEQSVADWLIGYFSKFGIKAKTYKVSNKGIAIRFSSKVFNILLSSLCGSGANNKHLPYLNGTWMKVWSQKQFSKILSCFWLGDGSGSSGSICGFRSTSKICIYEIASIFNAIGMPSLPSVDSPSKRGKPWSDCWSLYFTGDRSVQLCDFFDGKEFTFIPSSCWKDLGDSWAISIEKIIETNKKGVVYDMQVAEDHSFTANLHKVSNCHYCRKEHSHNQRVMLMQQNHKTLAEVQSLIESGEGADIFELQDTNLWLKSEEELNEKWETDYQDVIDYERFKIAKATTVELAESAKGVQINREVKLPKIPNADDVLWDEIKAGFVKRNCPKNPVYAKRIREEYELIKEKGFSSYFIIQKMMTDEARRKGPEILGFGDGSEAVGPGRGCLHPKTPIRLENGSVRPIGEIVAGDRVFTLDGTARTVQKTMKYPLFDESLIRIKTYYGDYFGVPLTGDHKVYAEKRSRLNGLNNCDDLTQKSRKTFEEPTGSCEWIRADQLTVGDWCFVPTPKVCICPISETIDLADCLYNPEANYVPDFVLSGSLSIVEKYLAGCFISFGREDEDKIKFEVTSPILAEQIRFLLLRLGVPSSLMIDERVANTQASYIVMCPLDHRLNLSKNIQLRHGWHPVDGGILLRIREISEEIGPDYVCDIQVEENHNYLTSSFLVHNSACGSLVAYCLRLHDVDPILHDLRFSRFLSPARGGKQMKIKHTISPIRHETEPERFDQ